MNIDIKRRLKNKTRYIHGLTEVLEFEIDILRKHIAECNLTKIKESVSEIEKTLQKLALITNEIEYILNLDN